MRRFVRLSAISLSRRLRTGSSSASFFTVRRPMEWDITHCLHPGQARSYPQLWDPFSEPSGCTGDERRNPDSRISLSVNDMGNIPFTILLRDLPTRCFGERVWRA